MPRETVGKEADKLVTGARGSDYGHPSEADQRIAAMWSIILGVAVKPKDVPLMMIAFKMCREMNKHKRDNLVDIAGYAQTLEMHHERDMEDKGVRIPDSTRP